MMLFRIAALCLVAVGLHGATLYGPTSYFSTADRPAAFSGPFAWQYFENFEDHALNTPGVTGNGIATTLFPFASDVIDSVDQDDGAVNGTCVNTSTQCESYFGNISPLRFVFSAGVLGALPTHVGIVWTDGNNPITFTAFGPGNVVLGTLTGSHAGPLYTSDVNEDRFYGAVDSGGILAIEVANTPGIEVDHLFYARLNDTAIPEAGTDGLAAIGLVAITLGLAYRRQQTPSDLTCGPSTDSERY